MEKITITKNDVAGLKAFLDRKMKEGYVLSSIKGNDVEFATTKEKLSYYLMYGKIDMDAIEKYGLTFVGRYGNIQIHVTKGEIEQDIMEVQRDVIKGERILLVGILTLTMIVAVGRLRSYAVFSVLGAPAAMWYLVTAVLCMAACVLGIAMTAGHNGIKAMQWCKRISILLAAGWICCLGIALFAGMSRIDFFHSEGKDDIVEGVEAPFVTLKDMDNAHEMTRTSLYDQFPTGEKIYENKYAAWTSPLLEGKAYSWYETGIVDGGTVSLMVNYYPAKTEGIASALVKQTSL